MKGVETLAHSRLILLCFNTTLLIVIFSIHFDIQTEKNFLVPAGIYSVESKHKRKCIDCFRHYRVRGLLLVLAHQIVSNQSSFSGESNVLRNCSAVNQTFESLSIVCMNSSLVSSGNSDQKQQRYILEVTYIGFIF